MKVQLLKAVYFYSVDITRGIEQVLCFNDISILKKVCCLCLEWVFSCRRDGTSMYYVQSISCYTVCI